MKKLFLYIILLCAGTSYLFSQDLSRYQLDQMFNDYLKIRNKNIETNSAVRNEHVKCGFSQVNSVVTHFNSFTPAQQEELKTLLLQPNLQTSIVSPSGFFRIHYDTSGINTPKYYTSNDLTHYSLNALLKIYIDSLAIAADSAYNFEVNFLGYPPPPPDNGSGGDNKYDIYIENLGNTYGFTQFEFSSGYTGPSFMEVNSDFTGFPTLGINAVRVTVAHEFHHAIQVGNYIYRDADAWFHELTSTSMEEFVYNTVNDYYNYMDNYFNFPARSIAENDVINGDGYDLAIWNLFMKDKFGFDIIKRQWQLMPIERAITAINQSIVERGALFNLVLNEFGVRVFYTNKRINYAPPGLAFSEGANYPPINYPITRNFPPYNSINGNNYPASNNYLRMIIQQNSTIDTLVTIATNSDFNAAAINTDSIISFQYNVSSSTFAGAKEIAGKYFVQLTGVKPEFWTDSEILNNYLVNSGFSGIEVHGPVNQLSFLLKQNYPNPFNPSTNIEFNLQKSSLVKLEIFNSLGQKVVTLLNEFTTAGQHKISFNASGLPSGVYFYKLVLPDQSVSRSMILLK